MPDCVDTPLPKSFFQLKVHLIEWGLFGVWYRRFAIGFRFRAHALKPRDTNPDSHRGGNWEYLLGLEEHVIYYYTGSRIFTN